MHNFNQERLDMEWAALNAIRETLVLSGRSIAETTYDESLALATELLPELFDPKKSLIARGHEPPAVREYREMAEARSIQTQTAVLPEHLLAAEIKEVQNLLQHGKKNRNMLRRLQRLESHKRYFASKSYSEHQLIRRDVFQAQRANLPKPVAGDNYTEFDLGKSQFLRIRMLHPDRPEHATGADLVYEIVDEEHRMIRFVFLQYKIWDGERLYFSSAANLDEQLTKLEKAICKNGYCAPGCDYTPPHSYRLPHCAAFLRLTDQLQRPDARLVSSGLHIPACVVSKIGSDESRRTRTLDRSILQARSISANIFEELFRSEMLGSEWITYEKAEGFYRTNRLLNSDERIVVYAQQHSES